MGTGEMGGCVGGEGSEEARADAAATEREREREREWGEAADAVAYDSCTWPPPVVAVCGPGNSGKSAFSRLLLNTLVGRLVIDKETGKPKGYGFCEYKDEEIALSARRNLQGYEINGRQLRVYFAKNGRNTDRNREKVEDPQFITVEEPYFSPCKSYVKMKACIALAP